MIDEFDEFDDIGEIPSLSCPREKTFRITSIKIKEIELPVPNKRSFLREKRCSRIVKSCGTRFSGKKKSRCGRFATFEIDGIEFCTQHAGEMALKYLLNKEDK